MIVFLCVSHVLYFNNIPQLIRTVVSTDFMPHQLILTLNRKRSSKINTIFLQICVNAKTNIF